MALFGVVAPETGLDKYEVQTVALSMLLAKRLILQHWKSEAVPTFDMWIMELGKILHLERIHFIKEKKERVFFLSMWESFINLMGKFANCAGAS